MYATAADLIAKYGETEIVRLSGGRDASGLVLDEARCESAIADAEATVDSYLRSRYAVPLASPAREVVLAVLVIARHELAQGDGRMPTEQMIEARKEVIRWLEKVAAGTVKIAGAASAADGETTIADAAASGGGSIFADRLATMTPDGRGFI